MSLSMTRRTALVTGAAALCSPSIALASAEGRRVFDIFRNGSNIGEHVVSVSQVGDETRAETNADIAIKFLGITAYRYVMRYEETYRGGALVNLNGETNDDGDAHFVRAVSEGGMLAIEGSRYTGPAPANAMPTSYWSAASRQRTPWISAQSGLLFNVSISETSIPDAPSGSRNWTANDPAEDFNVDLFYDQRDQWIGLGFDAGGERALYVLREESGLLALNS